MSASGGAAGVVVALLVGWASVVAAATPLWITDTHYGAGLLAIDPETAERSYVDLSDWPVVMSVGVGVQAPTGQLFLEAVNAAQGRTVIRFDPATGGVVGVSGYVDRDAQNPRGDGPGLEPGVTAMTVGPWGVLYVLRRFAGPMQVDVATGDRRLISQSVAPPVGWGTELRDPLDIVLEPRGSLLVADRWAGLVRIEPDDGSRRVAWSFPDLLEAPHRLERLPDGRLVHAFGAGDGRELTVLDRTLQTAAQLSGDRRGAGPDLLGVADVTVTADGSVYVLDLRRGAILAVDPATGDRRVVADDPTGSDLAILSLEARFVGATVAVAPPPPRTPAGRVGG